MAKRHLAPGTTALLSRVVRKSDLASDLAEEPPDAFPPVLATAKMVAMMELAAARVLIPLLEKGEMSVGVFLDVRHTAATPVGAKVITRARFRGMEGKFYCFEIEAFDDGGPIGHAIHERAIVSTDRLVEGAKKRCGRRPRKPHGGA